MFLYMSCILRLKYSNFTKFPGVKFFWESTVSVGFRANHLRVTSRRCYPKLYGNCAFQTKKKKRIHTILGGRYNSCIKTHKNWQVTFACFYAIISRVYKNDTSNYWGKMINTPSYGNKYQHNFDKSLNLLSKGVIHIVCSQNVLKN